MKEENESEGREWCACVCTAHLIWYSKDLCLVLLLQPLVQRHKKLHQNGKVGVKNSDCGSKRGKWKMRGRGVRRGGRGKGKGRGTVCL